LKHRNRFYYQKVRYYFKIELKKHKVVFKKGEFFSQKKRNKNKKDCFLIKHTTNFIYFFKV